jgi:streptomycin 6-kinase
MAQPVAGAGGQPGARLGDTVGRPYRDATDAFVAEATGDDGTPVVLKLLIPRAVDVVANEIIVLRLANGDGCVRLLREDAARGAMLLERLGRSMHELALPFDQRLAILCSAAARIWRPAPGCGLPTGADRRRLIEFITTTWEDLDRPCSERAIDYARDCAERRIAAHDGQRAVLVHAPPRRPVRTCPVAGGAYRLGRHRHLGVGLCRASTDRAALNQDRPPTRGSSDARGRRPRSRSCGTAGAAARHRVGRYV